MNNITLEGRFDLSELKWIDLADDDVEKFTVRRGDLLFNRTNSRELVGKTAVWDIDQSFAFAGYLVRVRFDPKKAIPEYVSAFLNSSVGKAMLFARAKPSVNMSNISASDMLRLPIPWPPLTDQKRIVAILDKADSIRRKRREATKLALTFRRSAFVELFGNPAINYARWPMVEFSQTLDGGMRNGISPSARGEQVGKVLVLSAITGPVFDHAAVKGAKFDQPFDDDQLVKANEFLICRGNGNLNLVGTGRFPWQSLNDTVFPDTMIAARINRQLLEPEFLEEIWATPYVRSQLERGARTTNGTHKINQQVLAAITFPLPPVSAQKRYTQIVATVSRVLDRYRNSLADDLFNALVQRAFRGEL
jgi:type I restriction enzyme S subunit